MVQAVLQDWRTAPVNERVRATLGFLEKLTLLPGEIGPEDLAPLREAGVGEQGIEDVILICSLFSIIDRLADALGFEVPEAESLARGAEHVLKHGYL